MKQALSIYEVKKKLLSGAFERIFTSLYGPHKLTEQAGRWLKALDSFMKNCSCGEDSLVSLYSAPGRTEVGGNHTDHENGRVLAAAVNLDIIAVVSRCDANTVFIKSEGYRGDRVDLGDLEKKTEEIDKSVSLVRGICARFNALGYKTGGFNAYTTSQVLKGSGLSSSAAYEVLVGTILNGEFNKGAVSAVEIAQISQYAENEYFGKLSGLMDQTASSVGSFVAIDFEDDAKPVINKLDFDFAASGYRLCIVDSGGGHADLSEEYSAVTREMRAVAAYFGKKVLREVSETEFYKHIPEVRPKYGDRAVLRAMHFFDENRRALEEAAALRRGDFPQFLKLVNESGLSSYMYLQNAYAASATENQAVPVALALSKRILGGEGACRVHGGGFGGTIQVFVPETLLEKYREKIEIFLGAGKCYTLSIRPHGGICVSDFI